MDKAQTAIEAAADLAIEYGDDLPDSTVFEHCEFVANMNDEIGWRTPLGMAVLAAYNNKSAKAGYDTFAMWAGIDIRPRATTN